jgi:hypothetical protein
MAEQKAPRYRYQPKPIKSFGCGGGQKKRVLLKPSFLTLLLDKIVLGFVSHRFQSYSAELIRPY